MNKIAASLCVVDDDASIRESVEGLLWAEGLRVETYCSAREFLARTTVEPPGCLELQRELFRTEAHIPVEIREPNEYGA
jgi:FixJ family two-component response regulator